MLDVLVVGGLNNDLVMPVDHLPLPGETVRSAAATTACGGKGANQATAAARAGARVALIGAVGGDDAGARQVQALHDAGVDTAAVAVLPSVPTTLAVVLVDRRAENSIVVADGASVHLDPTVVAPALRRLGPARVVLVQTEVGEEVARSACRAATAAGARLVLSAAPVVALEAHALSHADPLLVNEGEAAELLSSHGADAVAAPELARALRSAVGARSVVVTLGSRGAVVASDSGEVHVPAREALAVDTTGAGDAFAGALAAALASGAPLERAVAVAASVASDAVGVEGARLPGPVADARASEPHGALAARSDDDEEGHRATARRAL